MTEKVHSDYLMNRDVRHVVYASAARRLAACLNGEPRPPHDTWTIEMIKYDHVVKYDDKAKKITIMRVYDPESDLTPGESELYTELSLRDISATDKTLDRVGRWLGEALIFST